MDNLEEIKKRKLEELQKQAAQPTQEQQLQQQVEQLELIVKQAFTKEALERFGNLKAAHPEKAIQILVILAQALQAGQLQKIDDTTLRELLKKITPEKKDFKIKRA